MSHPSRKVQTVTRVAETAQIWSDRINAVVQRLCVALLVVLVLDVWLGVMVRYVIPLPLTFTEELARYLMIWMALLAISSGISPIGQACTQRPQRMQGR